MWSFSIYIFSCKYDNMDIVTATIHSVFKLAKSEISTTKL